VRASRLVGPLRLFRAPGHAAWADASAAASTRNDARPLPRLHVVRHTREQPAQLNRGRQLALLLGCSTDRGGGSSKAVTGTQTGSQQTNTPATGTALGATSTQTVPTYPATVGPTGSTQPDATNPARSSPAGGCKN
jgi:hypothetical protein